MGDSSEKLKSVSLNNKPSTVQERIIQWRFNHDSLPKRIIGFWLKLMIEFTLMIGVPVAVFTGLILAITDFSLSALPHIPQSVDSWIIAWLILTSFGWITLRCIMSDGVEVIIKES